MSGHSKWSNIHRKKEANDKVRSGIFTKLAANITVAVSKGGGITDPDMNFSLRLAVDKARAANMPKENIDRAIAKAGGKGGVSTLAELVIEGFSPEGVAFMAAIVTDNRNRSVAELRTLIEKHGGRMGEMGSVAYLFKRVGIINYDGRLDDEKLLSLIDVGMIEVKTEYDEEEGVEHSLMYTLADSLHSVVVELQKLGMDKVSGVLGYLGVGGVAPSNEESLANFIEIIEDHPDVQEVYVNLV